MPACSDSLWVAAKTNSPLHLTAGPTTAPRAGPPEAIDFEGTDMKIICAFAISLLAPSIALSLPAQAATIEINYDFSGGLTAAPVFI
jgi:hypothetical protein